MPKEEARTKIKLFAFLDSRKAKHGGKQREGTAEQQRETTRQPGQYCTCPMSLLEQLQDADNYVINITKPRSLQDRENQVALELDQHRAWASKTGVCRFASLPQTFWHDAGPLPSLLQYRRSKKGKIS